MPVSPSDPLEARLAALKRYDILDTPPEQEFDDLVFLAAFICDSPMALITLLDAKRQWFKSKRGLAVNETPIEHAFCAHAFSSVGCSMCTTLTRTNDSLPIRWSPGRLIFAFTPERRC
jgi:hypothetical protein